MSSDSPLWNIAAVSQGTARTRFANHIQHFLTVTSTSTLALEAAHAGASEGAVWVADEQTAGRGRGGHAWHSEPRAGVYLSLLLRPAMPAEQALLLSLATGLAVQSAIAQITGHTPDLRWPNDLILNDRKVGGILVETALTAEQPPAIRHAVIGIGINVAHRAFPVEIDTIATSLFLATGQFHPRELLLAAILRSLDNELNALEAGAHASQTLLDRFTRASTWVQGKPVQVGEGDGYTGITAGLDPRGFLRVLADDGTLHTVLSGGVRPR